MISFCPATLETLIVLRVNSLWNNLPAVKIFLFWRRKQFRRGKSYTECWCTWDQCTLVPVQLWHLFVESGDCSSYWTNKAAVTCSDSFSDASWHSLSGWEQTGMEEESEFIALNRCLGGQGSVLSDIVVVLSSWLLFDCGTSGSF